MNENRKNVYMELCTKLRSMRLSGMAEKLEEQAANPNIDLTPADIRIADIIESEGNMRNTQKFSRYLKKAQLRYPDASLDDTIYEPDRLLDIGTIQSLLDCNWINEGRNVLITGKTGAGKSYYANVIAISALRKFKTVRYYKTRDMIYDLEKARLEGRITESIIELYKIDLLILDDFGFMDLDPDNCRYLFEVIDAREGRKSIIVISQLPIESWYSIFKDSTYAEACLDRMVCDAYRLEFNGRNMRNPNLQH